MSYLALKLHNTTTQEIIACSPSIIAGDFHCTVAHFRAGPKISEDLKNALEKLFNVHLGAKTNFGWITNIRQLGSEHARVWAIILDKNDFIKEMRNKALEVLSSCGIEVSLDWDYLPHITITNHPLIVLAKNFPEKIFFNTLAFVE